MMPSPAQPTIRNNSKDFIFLLGIGMAAVAALVVYLLWSSYREAILGAETISRNYATIIETRLDATFRRAEAELLDQSRTLTIDQLRKPVAAEQAEAINAELDARLFNFPEVSGLRIFDAEGDLLYASSRASLRQFSIADRDYFRELRDGPWDRTVFSQPLVGLITGKEVMVVSRALRDPTGAFRGVVNAVIELDYFQNIFRSMDVGTNGTISIFRRDNLAPVLRSPPTAQASKGPVSWDRPVPMAIADGQRTGTLQFAAASDGILRILSFRVLERYPFFVTVGLALDDVLAGWERRTLAVGLTGMLLMLVISILLFRAWRAELLRGQMSITLSKSKEWARLVLDKSMNAVIGTDSEGRVTEWNAGAVQMFGYAVHEAQGKDLSDLIVPPAQGNPHAGGLDRFIVSNQDLGTGKRRETTAIRADGTTFPVELSIAHIQTDTESFFSAIARDITERKKGETDRMELESRLREAQKLEAIGKLTGGMAHDFNNYLGVIIGNLDLLKGHQSLDFTAAKLADAALNGALCGAELTRSLLAFSRRQPLKPQRIDVNNRVEAMTTMLQRTLGEDITLSSSFAPNLWPVRIDGVQLDTCILNLANNARDAMARGGTLTISTRNITLGAQDLGPGSDVLPGDYVSIDVSDTGTGMSPETLSQAFEPFFTTKQQGHGTGLGLSMVYGFVKQSGGHIRISSEIGGGTTVHIFLPRLRSAENEANAASLAASSPPNGGTETILVVEDNPGMRQTAMTQLTSLGYRVIEAENGAVALTILSSREPHIDLLFSDVVMPGNLDGHELAKLALKLRPEIKVLLTSGFPGNSMNDRTQAPSPFSLLHKPYRILDLVMAIRAALDGEAARSNVMA